MTNKEITDAIMGVARGEITISEGASKLCMLEIDFERMMNAWEDAQIAWDKMLQIAIVSELKNGKTDQTIIEALNCSKSEVERAEKRWKKTQQIFEEVREKTKTPTCGSCIARVYISELARMMEQQQEAS